MQEIESTVKAIISNCNGRDVAQINVYDHLVDDLGLDSLDLGDVILDIEEYFDIVVPDKDAEQVIDVDDLIILVNELTGNAEVI